MPFQVRPVSYGLTATQAGLRPTPSALCVRALVTHVPQGQQNGLIPWSPPV